MGRGKTRPQQRVCASCQERYGSAESGPVRSFIVQLTRAQAAGLPATLTWQEWQQTCADFHHHCAYCGHRWAQVLEHYLPLDQYGGGTCVENCLPACQACNWRKGRKPPERTTFSPVTMERLRCYLNWRRQGIQLTVEEVGKAWEWLLPPAWRDASGYGAWYGGWEKVTRPGSLQESVLAKIHQAEDLKRVVAQTPEDDPKYLQRLLEWAIASDEATRLVLRAEERLSQEAVHTLRAHCERTSQWETYCASPSRLRAVIERYLAL
jgi:hypothetical protein